MTRSSFNSQAYQILAVGRDISELSAGANLLTQAGYTTDLVVTPEQAVRRAVVARYHLAVVSATFSYDEQIAIRARLKQVKPTLPILLVGPEHAVASAFLDAVANRLKKKPTLEFNSAQGKVRRDELTE